MKLYRRDWIRRFLAQRPPLQRRPWPRIPWWTVLRPFLLLLFAVVPQGEVEAMTGLLLWSFCTFYALSVQANHLREGNGLWPFTCLPASDEAVLRYIRWKVVWASRWLPLEAAAFLYAATGGWHSVSHVAMLLAAGGLIWVATLGGVLAVTAWRSPWFGKLATLLCLGLIAIGITALSQTPRRGRLLQAPILTPTAKVIANTTPGGWAVQVVEAGMIRSGEWKRSLPALGLLALLALSVAPLHAKIRREFVFPLIPTEDEEEEEDEEWGELEPAREEEVVEELAAPAQKVPSGWIERFLDARFSEEERWLANRLLFPQANWSRLYRTAVLILLALPLLSRLAALWIEKSGMMVFTGGGGLALFLIVPVLGNVSDVIGRQTPVQGRAILTFGLLPVDLRRVLALDGRVARWRHLLALPWFCWLGAWIGLLQGASWWAGVIPGALVWVTILALLPFFSIFAISGGSRDQKRGWVSLFWILTLMAVAFSGMTVCVMALMEQWWSLCGSVVVWGMSLAFREGYLRWYERNGFDLIG